VQCQLNPSRCSSKKQQQETGAVTAVTWMKVEKYWHMPPNTAQPTFGICQVAKASGNTGSNTRAAVAAATATTKEKTVECRYLCPTAAQVVVNFCRIAKP